MPQFDIYRNLNLNTNRNVPYILDVQADLLNHLATRVVVPLMLATKVAKLIKDLNFAVEVEGKRLILITNDLAAVSAHTLGAKVASLQNKRSEIIAALDFLFMGF